MKPILTPLLGLPRGPRIGPSNYIIFGPGSSLRQDLSQQVSDLSVLPYMFRTTLLADDASFSDSNQFSHPLPAPGTSIRSHMLGCDPQQHYTMNGTVQCSGLARGCHPTAVNGVHSR